MNAHTPITPTALAPPDHSDATRDAACRGYQHRTLIDLAGRLASDLADEFLRSPPSPRYAAEVLEELAQLLATIGEGVKSNAVALDHLAIKIGDAARKVTR